MSFDPITYAMVREAKPPAGSVVPSFAVDPAVLQQGWNHLDGSLVSRTQYPDAAAIIGDVRFFDGTPTLTETTLTMRAGVTSMSVGKQLAVGSTFVLMPTQYGASAIYTLRLWRSSDAGVSWNSYDLGGMPYGATYFTVEHLEWFGGNRMLMVIRGNDGASANYAVTFSTDLGLTWSTPRALASVASGVLVLQSVSADAEMVSSGAGYYYFSFLQGTAVPYSGLIVALNPSTNAVSSFTVSHDGTYSPGCQLLGGRIISGGTSEVHFAVFSAASWNMQKLTFNGAAFSGNTSSQIVYSSSYFGAGRQYLTTGGGNYYFARSNVVYKLPAGWSGTPLAVHTGVDNVANRLLTNTLSNPVTGQRLDLSTGIKSIIGGMNAGVPKIGSLYGFANVSWAEATVNDKTPSNDRHFLSSNGVSGTLAVRTTRCADNFLGGFANTTDAGRFLLFSSGQINWYDAGTGNYKTVNFAAGSPNKVQVNTYSFANDYSNYLHLPYLPGLTCRLK